MPVKDKKKPSGGEKPLTAFFARAPKAKLPSSPTKPNPTPTKFSVASSGAHSASSSSETNSMKFPTTPVRKVSRKRSLSPECHPSNIDQPPVSLSTPKGPCKKKVRLSPRQEPSCRATNLVPSSQSDEEELPAAMSVVDDSQPSLEQCVSSEVQSSPFSIDGASPSSHDSLAFSSSSKQSLTMPTTPVALDASAKTAQLIEQIKQRAYAAVHSSPESTTLEFNEDLDDDSDEEDVPFALTSLTLLPKAKSEIPSDPSSRYALRKRNPSPTQPMKVYKQISPMLVPTKKKANPFDTLLKEKKAAEKKGTGNEAIRRADAIAKDMEQFNSITDGEEEFDGDEVQGTDALNLAIKSKDLFQAKHRRKGVSTDDKDEFRDTGKEIVGILERDVAIKEEDAHLQRPRGIHLWRQDYDSIMEVDATTPVYRFPGKSDIANTVNSFIKNGGWDRVASLLRVDFTTAMPTVDLAQLFESVIDWELAPKGLTCIGTMSNTVEQLATMVASTFSFEKLLTILRGLGADADVLHTQKWAVPPGGPMSPISLEDREDAIYRLTTTLGLFAKYGKLAMGELPEFVTALLLVALDETTAADNQQDVIQLIDTICNLTETDMSKEIELCLRVLTFIITLEPSIQCNAVLMLAQGTRVTRRLANYIAYCVLVDQTTVDPSTYSDKPSIEEIRRQFQRTPDHLAKFVIREDTDYVDLGFYITILGVAVSDIRGYVSQERQVSKKASAEIDHSTAKPLVGLKGLRDDLEILHSRISDARATHLERSRTKGCIKSLSMNLHYQRDLWTKNDAENKAKTLAQYFRKK